MGRTFKWNFRNLPSSSQLHSLIHPSDSVPEILLAKVHVSLALHKGLLERLGLLSRELETKLCPR